MTCWINKVPKFQLTVEVKKLNCLKQVSISFSKHLEIPWHAFYISMNRGIFSENKSNLCKILVGYRAFQDLILVNIAHWQMKNLCIAPRDYMYMYYISLKVNMTALESLHIVGIDAIIYRDKTHSITFSPGFL